MKRNVFSKLSLKAVTKRPLGAAVAGALVLAGVASTFAACSGSSSDSEGSQSVEQRQQDRIPYYFAPCPGPGCK